MLQLLLCRLLHSARVGVAQKCFDSNFDGGSLEIESGLSRFGQISRCRFLGIFQIMDECLRLFPTSRLRCVPDEIPRLGSSLNPLATSAASIGGALCSQGGSDAGRRTAYGGLLRKVLVPPHSRPLAGPLYVYCKIALMWQ
jgi:hypothetical protein